MADQAFGMTDFEGFRTRAFKGLGCSEIDKGSWKEAESGGKAGLYVFPEGIVSISWTPTSGGSAVLVPWEDVRDVRHEVVVKASDDLEVHKLTMRNPDIQWTGHVGDVGPLAQAINLRRRVTR